MIATVTSVMASMYSTSRMLGMMSDMGEVPEVTVGRRVPFGNPPLVVTTGVAIVLTVAFDLTRIAALGAFAYLSLDMVIHWGHFRHLRDDTGARPSLLLVAVGLDAVLLIGFLAYRATTDLLVVGAFAVFAVARRRRRVALHAALPADRQRRGRYPLTSGCCLANASVVEVMRATGI